MITLVNILIAIIGFLAICRGWQKIFFPQGDDRLVLHVALLVFGTMALISSIISARMG